MKQISQQSKDYQRIETAIRFLENNFRSQPTLDQIAASVKLSQYHFDRLFKRWAGVSPIQFLQFLTLGYTKKKLASAQTVLETALEAGLSGPGRLHDLFVTFDAMTPGQYKRAGAGLEITYGYCETCFGECFLALTDRGVCQLSFVQTGHRTRVLKRLQKTWPKAGFAKDQARVDSVVERIFRIDQGHQSKPFHLLLKGTNFQINVWRALLSIPRGGVVSYQDIAMHIGRPKATRAVANAIAGNPVSYLIPCHRVISKSGHTHRYGGGALRKKALLGWEAAKVLRSGNNL